MRLRLMFSSLGQLRQGCEKGLELGAIYLPLYPAPKRGSRCEMFFAAEGIGDALRVEALAFGPTLTSQSKRLEPGVWFRVEQVEALHPELVPWIDSFGDAEKPPSWMTETNSDRDRSDQSD